VSASNLPKLERLRWWHLRLIRETALPATERALAGSTLARLGDPRFDAEAWYLPKEPLLGFVQIPAGPFLMGSSKQQDRRALDEETPQHQVTLPGYYVARFPVTVEQFRSFVYDSGYQPADPASVEGVSNHPVVNVTWHEAVHYTRWLDARLRERARVLLTAPLGPEEGGFWKGVASGRLCVVLPSEAEWEKAARGVDGRRYPWGTESDPDRANCSDSGVMDVSSVGCFPGGASPYGCEEMSGNVWEWTRSLEGWYPYPADPIGTRQREDLAVAGIRVLRGGSFAGDFGLSRCASRGGLLSSFRNGNLGFRVAISSTEDPIQVA
jgi:formylglycine-generating enzyme required for sulfatase activity